VREQTRSADEQLTRIQAVTDATLAHLDLDDLLGELLDRVREILLVDTAAVLLMDRAGRHLVATAAKGIEEEVRQGIQIPVGMGFAGRIAAERQPVIIDDVDHTNVLNPILRDRGIRSLLGVPLVESGLVIGVLHVGTLQPRRFSAEDAELLQLVADRVALATQAKRTKQERAAAATLQRSLLPVRPPAIAGLDFAARYVSGEDGGVGGDWYDAFSLPSGGVALMIGDVVGRGLGSAVVMGRLRSALRAYSLEWEDPAEVLSRLDAMVAYFFEPEQFVTVLYAVLDPSFRKMHISSAGHPAPVLASPAGPARFVDIETDPPIGVMQPGKRRSSEVAIPPGSTVYLFTDGLVERRGLSLDQGLEMLREAALPVSAEMGCTSILFSLVGNQVPDDDIALLAIHSEDRSGSPLDPTLPGETPSFAKMRAALKRRGGGSAGPT
jgi:serine phosphatase RsbU (regulator of sigma subunit)